MFLSRLQAKTTTRAEKMGLQLRDKKVLVVGLARTGIAVARFLKSKGVSLAA